MLLQALKQLEVLAMSKAAAGEQGPLQAWDYAFYARQIKATQFQVDDNVSIVVLLPAALIRPQR